MTDGCSWWDAVMMCAVWIFTVQYLISRLGASPFVNAIWYWLWFTAAVIRTAFALSLREDHSWPHSLGFGYSRAVMCVVHVVKMIMQSEHVLKHTTLYNTYDATKTECEKRAGLHARDGLSFDHVQDHHQWLTMLTFKIAPTVDQVGKFLLRSTSLLLCVRLWK